MAQVVDVGLFGLWAAVFSPFLPKVQLVHQSYVPGRHHTACRVSQNRVVLYGGGDNPEPGCLRSRPRRGRRCGGGGGGGGERSGDGARRGLARRAILAAGLTRSEQRAAGHRRAAGPRWWLERQPTPRKFHAACSLYPWRPLLVIFGGWQVDRHFDDMWVLAHGGDLASYGSPDGYGSDDDDEVEIVLQVGGRRERVLIERSTLEALLENGRFRQMRTAPSP